MTFRGLYLAALACTGAVCLTAAMARAGSGGDPVLVRAGERSITRAALLRHVLTYNGRKALDQMADRAALQSEAARLKVQPTDAEYASREEESRRAVPGGLEKALADQGISSVAWQEGVRDALLAEKVLDKKWPVKDSDLIRMQVRFCLVATREKARQIIQAVRGGQNFEVIALRESMEGRENGNLVAPEPFLRVDNPPFFAATMRANLRVGQLSREPIESGEYWLVLRLEQYLPPETLTGKAREAAVARIKAYRMSRLIPALRQRFRPERPIPYARVLEETSMPGDTVLQKVGEISHTRRQLISYALERAGVTSLNQLTERAVTQQLADRHNVRVSAADTDARVAEARKGAGLSAAFQRVLDAEGITEDAWKERVYYAILAERLVNARAPLPPEELVRITARYIRVASRDEAASIIQALRNGGNWEQLRVRSLDKGDGFVRPRPFFRLEQPTLFQMIQQARLKPGDVLPTPAEAGNAGFIVLRLEQRQEADSLTGAERESALRRLNASRMGPLLDGWRKEIKVDNVTPLAEVLAEYRK